MIFNIRDYDTTVTVQTTNDIIYAEKSAKYVAKRNNSHIAFVEIPQIKIEYICPKSKTTRTAYMMQKFYDWGYGRTGFYDHETLKNIDPYDMMNE